MYSGIKFTNNASTQLTQTLLATDTVLYVGTNGASIFPKLDTTDDYFLLTLFDVDKNREVVKCTSRTDDSCTVVRAQEGTTAKTFHAGTLVELRLTADSITKVAEDASVTKPHASTDPAAYGQATAQVYSHAKLTDNFELGTQAINGVICTPYALQQAVARLTSVAGTQLITSSTTYIVPETGTYTVTCVGGGGNGGRGGNGSARWDAYSQTCITGCEDNSVYSEAHSGGGGGGGGAGQVITRQLSLTKGTSIPIIVGGVSGTTTFGTHITALGGGAGGNGGNARTGDGCSTGNRGSAGAVGVSYGTTSTAGTAGYSSVNVFCSNLSGNPGFVSVSGSSGGFSGKSLDGVYGNGGDGGQGGGANSSFYSGPTGYSGTSGASGTQGCVKITMKLGS